MKSDYISMSTTVVSAIHEDQSRTAPRVSKDGPFLSLGDLPSHEGELTANTQSSQNLWSGGFVLNANVETKATCLLC